MKRFKEVEEARVLAHRDPLSDSVHRSSLLVPELPGSDVEISFVNHFLLKRRYANVGCRITAIDPEGRKIASHLHPVTEPRVYRFPLSGSVPEPVSTYMVEFFAAENLAIPFPAVMINHRGPGFLNGVHAYNRVLNDVFEDDVINAHQVAEASVDVSLEDGRDTFAVFTAGPLACRGELEIELESPESRRRSSIPLDVPRFCQRVISLREVFPGSTDSPSGVLKIRQPQQFLFYGRMLTGIRTAGGQFSANHSYYDLSSAPEYWEDRRGSFRAYPCFPSFRSAIRMYPIQSPGRLSISVGLHSETGAELARVPVGELVSPGGCFLDVSIDQLAESAGIGQGRVRSFVVYAETESGGVPCRVNHQLAYSSGALASSINVSLFNPNVFSPPGRTGLTWGQVMVGDEIDSRFAIVGNSPVAERCDVELSFYDESGRVADARRSLDPGGTIEIDPMSDFGLRPGRNGEARPVWVMVRSVRSDITFFSVTRDRLSGHCTGEHGF
jgi:hypothetical protein